MNFNKKNNKIKVILSIFIIFIITSCMQEPEKFENIVYPEVCFQNNADFDRCKDQPGAPLPSDYAAAAVPDGLPLALNFPGTTPLNIRVSSPIDENSLENGVYLLKVGFGKFEVVKKENMKIILGKIDFTTFTPNDDKSYFNLFLTDDDGNIIPWEEGYTYMVVFTKELKDIENLSYKKPIAFYLASSDFDISVEFLQSIDTEMSDAKAEATLAALLAMRKSLDEGAYPLIEFLLDKTRFDVSFLWTNTFNSNAVCFQHDNQACTNVIPIPSDFMAMALPEGTDLNFATISGFTLDFTSGVDTATFKDHLIIVKKSLTVDTDISIIDNNDLDVNLSIDNDKKVIITPKSGKWDGGYTYLIYLKRGILNNNGINFEPSLAYFFSTLSYSLLDAEGKPAEVLQTLGFNPKNAEDIATAQTLEGLRQFNQPLIGLLTQLNETKSVELLMNWTVTLKSDIIIPCFNSDEFPGCEDVPLAPLPSDFIMKYEADGTHHLNLPIKEDDSEMIKMMLGGLNTLDGWSTSKPFSLYVSNDLDISTIKTDLRDMANNPANLMVLKLITNDLGEITGAEPAFVTASFNEDWNKLLISPVLRKWDETSTYLIVMKNDIKGKDGEQLVKSIPFSFMSEVDPLVETVDGKVVSKYAALDDETAQMLEAGRLQFSAAYSSLAAFGITRADVAMMWTVTTQTVTSDMKNIALGIKANSTLPEVLTIDTVIENLEITTYFANRINSYWMKGGPVKFDNISKIAIGKFKAPWMLNEMNVFDPNKLGGNLVASDFIDVPVLIAFPQEETEITANSKVMIYKHGINDAKEEVLPLLDMFTSMGYIVFSIDLPLHGARTTCDDLYDNFNPLRELPDGVPDCTGEGFLGLNVFATRDLIRQAVIEQIMFVKILKTVNFNSLEDSIKFSTIDSSNIKYFGFSLGTIIGNIFISVDDSIKSAILNVGGGGLLNILYDTKESINGSVFASLEAMGLKKGTKELDDFLYLAQTIADPADPINYKRDFPILLQKSINDPVMPNNTTDDLAITLGLLSPLTGQVSPNYKSYQMDDYDPYKLYWHSFTLIPKSSTINAASRLDVMNFFNNN